MYQVGFGDCILLSVFYRRAIDGRNERHLLIDFGSTHSPRRGGAKVLERAAELIEEHTGGQLDVIVATHRHKDHIDGFGAAATAAVIDKLNPRLVVRPWTDDPRLPADAESPSSRARFAASLAGGQHFSSLVASLVGAADARSLRGELARMAVDQLPNEAAIDRLQKWGERGRARYVHAGADSGIESVVPGIRVRVLGPPTIAQSPGIDSQRSSDPEYWMAQRAELKRAVPTSLTVEDDALAEIPQNEGVDPGPVSWLVTRLQRQQLASLLRIVRTVDDALNNTSVILLIDAGEKRLLFPGDAQIENWSWALREAPGSASLRQLLGRVDLYKVGHHGSRNATPRSLFRLWGDDPSGRAMVGLMSTMTGVHGRSEATRVPRATLVAALERRMTLLTTDGLPAGSDFIEVGASTARGRQFEVIGG